MSNRSNMSGCNICLDLNAVAIYKQGNDKYKMWYKVHINGKNKEMYE